MSSSRVSAVCNHPQIPWREQFLSIHDTMLQVQSTKDQKVRNVTRAGPFADGIATLSPLYVPVL